MKTAMTKKALLALAAVSTIAMATPALAQNYEAMRYGYGENHPYDVWGRDIPQRYAALRREAGGSMNSGRVARQFRAFEQARGVYMRDGRLNRSEVNDLNTRIENIQASLRYGGGRWNDRAARYGGGYGPGYDDGYGYGYGYGRR